MMWHLLLLANGIISNCQRGDSCWPTQEEVEALSNSLNPEMNRTFGTWEEGEPMISSFPYVPGQHGENVNFQPIAGFGATLMDPVYEMPYDQGEPEDCFSSEETRGVCFSGIRNSPHPSQDPAFVVWALTTDHVQKAVRFAVDHDLCISIFGTGHDFLNRHTCTDGVYIRTTLMQDLDWDLDDSRGYGWAEGNVKVGPGISFHALHKAAAENGKFVSSGWSPTVGIAGWSMGGGHGPVAGYAGLGVDNILEVEIVTADGEVLRANSTHNADLWKGIRGGGGSWIGIVTEFVIRTHTIPAGGFIELTQTVVGSFCNLTSRNTYFQRWQELSLSLDKRWSGNIHTQAQTPDLREYTNATLGFDLGENCGAYWSAIANYVFVGSRAEANATLEKFAALIDGLGGIIHDAPTPYPKWSVVEAPTFWDLVKDKTGEPLFTNFYYQIGVPSVSVRRETVESGTWLDLFLEDFDASPTAEVNPFIPFEIYDCITGRTDSEQPEDVSISTGFRTGMFHFVFAPTSLEHIQRYYDIEPHSYFSESHYGVMDWKTRYWDDYEGLVALKQKYDPNSLFQCEFCVGYERTGNEIDLLEQYPTPTPGPDPGNEDDSTTIALEFVIAIAAAVLIGLVGFAIWLRRGKATPGEEASGTDEKAPFTPGRAPLRGTTA